MDLLTFKNPKLTVASAVTPLLASQIQQATKSLPLAHLITPATRESFATLNGALQHLQNWAFT
jgi:hypothetical protein